jgi:hypothetical protein
MGQDEVVVLIVVAVIREMKVCDCVRGWWWWKRT